MFAMTYIRVTCYKINYDKLNLHLTSCFVVSQAFTKTYMNQSVIFTYHKFYTIYSFMGDMMRVFLISDQFSEVMKWKKGKQEPDLSVHEYSLILCPEVRCVCVCDLCWETPVERSSDPGAATPWAPWRWLFPPTHPTPPYPGALAENPTCKSCLSKQAGGLTFK